MKSRVFAVDIIRKPSYNSIWIYRCNRRDDGARLRQYRMTTDRAVRVLRGMVTCATTTRTTIRERDGHVSWTMPAVVSEQDTARASLKTS